MRLRLEKPWHHLTEESLASVPAQLGVYQLADEAERIIYSGFAGGDTTFGLRGELQRELRERPVACLYRYEVNMQYWSRHKELLMLHVADHGELPRCNDPEPLGRLDPA